MKSFAWLVLLAVFTASCGINMSPGESTKIGQVTSVHRQGILSRCQTWEMQIQRGGFSNGSGSTGAAFDITIPSDSLARVVRDDMERRVEVEVTYHSVFDYWTCSTDSGGDFLTGVRALNP